MTLAIDVWGLSPSKSGDHLCIRCQKWQSPKECSFRDAFPTKMLMPPRLYPTDVTDHLTYSQLPLPRHTKAFLDLNYGQDWETPKDHHSSGGKALHSLKHVRH